MQCAAQNWWPAQDFEDGREATTLASRSPPQVAGGAGQPLPVFMITAGASRDRH
ncbi:MAG: hypothetical protein H0T45_17335 [Pyrinomonadaceae bacterium]|nr:hypothetical protein [Pyrinomonadaceae bacterium]